jgi:hypothetical protein
MWQGLARDACGPCHIQSEQREVQTRVKLLSHDEAEVWQQFQRGLSTSAIAKTNPKLNWSVSYVSRVLNRAREKITKMLKDHAQSHRLDVESVLDYKGLLIGFDYQADTQVYICYTMKLGVVVWYGHDSYAGKLCPDCPKEAECRETLRTIREEYGIQLRPDEEKLYMTQQSTVIFNKLAAKESPRYQRSVS